MWITDSTPKACKECRTILLYKKGSKCELQTCRPIAMAETIHKPSTGLIARYIYIGKSAAKVFHACPLQMLKQRQFKSRPALYDSTPGRHTTYKNS